ncbi:MAG: xanthine dehydrogenase family protein subunit M [Anaerolineales bacterium]
MSKDVQYYAPETMEEALQILKEHGATVSVLAGGTDLVRDMNLEFKIPDGILWVGHLGLEYIEEEADTIRVGAATRMQTAARSTLIQEKAGALAHAAGKMASPPVRSLATIGGNLCNASPGADAGCALLGLDSEVVLTSSSGERVVALREFFTGPNETVMKPDELMTEIRLKPIGEDEGSSYGKIGRRKAMTLAVLNTTSRVKLDAQGNCETVQIAVGAAAPTLLRIEKAEKLLAGQPFTEEAILEAADIAAQEIKPIDDVHGSAWYRRKVTRVLVERTLRDAGRLNGGLK